MPDLAAQLPDGNGQDGRLGSWKEIAAYLRAGVRSVQRWEETEQLPVHRHAHDKRSTVYAFKRELDEWHESRRNTLVLEEVPGEKSDFTIEKSGESYDIGAVEDVDAVQHVPPESCAIPFRFPKPTRPGRFGAVILILVAAVIAVVIVLRHKPPVVYSLRLSVLAPKGTAFTYGTDAGGSAISPDGLALAFVADSEGTSKLWIRVLDSTNARPLTGTEGARHPFWSPDSRSIGFFARGKLKITSLTGTAPSAVCDAPFGRGGSWSSRGLIAFTPAPGASLRLVSDKGGTPRELTRLNALLEENAHLWPQFLPDGRHFVYLARSSNPENTATYVSSIDERNGDERKRLLSSTSNVLYSEGGGSGRGYLLFVRDGKLWAHPFEANSREPSGSPRLVADHVGFWSNLGLANFSVSTKGVIAYFAEGSDLAEIALVSREGATLSRLAGPDSWFSPRLSRNGELMAIARTEPSSGRSSLWLMEFSRGGLSRFTTGPGRDGSPVWSPDGTSICFLSVRGGPFALYSKNTNGSGAEQLMGRRDGSLIPYDWSNDGRFLCVGEYTSTGRLDVWMWPLTGSQKPFPLLSTPADELDVQFSRDGRWIAYTSDESGRDEVYVQAAAYEENSPARVVPKWQVSTMGGGQAKWRADAKEIFYRSAAGALTSVVVRTAASGLVFGTPRALFPLAGTPQFRGTYTYDSVADGQHFVILTPTENTEHSSITIVTNW